MGLATFRGGVHAYEGKNLSEYCAIKELEFDGDYVFPMSQGIGAPSKPIVAVGDYVLAGQKIAEPGGFVSAVVTSSVSGTVKAIEPRLNTMGNYVEAIVVESDGLYKEIEGVGAVRSLDDLTKNDIRAIIKEAGIIGMGGAGFPTHVKLTPKNDDQIDYVIANGSECEPMLTNDHRLMVEEPERVVGGMKVVLSLFPNAKGVIAIENNKQTAIDKIRHLISESDEKRISVVVMRTKYPEGGERQLIYAVTGRQINSKMLPADAGCVVDNVATLAAIYDAVIKSTPIMKKNITITGDAIGDPSNVRIRLGVSYKKIVEAIGGYNCTPAKVICGGPMMGMALFDTDVPVVKNSSALCAFAHDEVAESQGTHCVRCGRCVDACPIFLIPPIMAKEVEKGNLDKFQELNGMECIECGTCSYICPAKRPLTQLFKQARKEVMTITRAKQAAEKAKADAEKAAAEAKVAEDKKD